MLCRLAGLQTALRATPAHSEHHRPIEQDERESADNFALHGVVYDEQLELANGEEDGRERLVIYVSS